MNNKGMVLSSLVYILLVFFLLLILSLLTVMWYRSNSLSVLKDSANNIYDHSYSGETLLVNVFSTYVGSNGTYSLKNGGNYFSGSNPNNWVIFGQVSSTDSTPLLWRVIKDDVYGIKIIYEGIQNGSNLPTADGKITIGEQTTASWDTSGGTNGNNKWERPSDLSTILNTWYNSLYVPNITNYVAPINWCIGAIGGTPTISDFKTNECINQAYPAVGTFLGYTSSSLNYGMINPSDYVSASNDVTCNAYNQISCGNNNYLKKTYNYFTQNAYADDEYDVWSILNDGSININYANVLQSIRPVINIDPYIVWSSGTGSLANPYMMK